MKEEAATASRCRMLRLVNWLSVAAKCLARGGGGEKGEGYRGREGQRIEGRVRQRIGGKSRQIRCAVWGWMRLAICLVNCQCVLWLDLAWERLCVCVCVCVPWGVSIFRAGLLLLQLNEELQLESFSIRQAIYEHVKSHWSHKIQCQTQKVKCQISSIVCSSHTHAHAHLRTRRPPHCVGHFYAYTCMCWRMCRWSKRVACDFDFALIFHRTGIEWTQG